MVPVGIEDSLKKIFSAVIVGGVSKNNPNLQNMQQSYRFCMPKFLGQFNHNIFEDEYSLFYEVIKTLKVKTFNSHQLKTVISQNEDLILESPYIDLSKWASTSDGKQATSDEKIEAFTLEVEEKFMEFSNEYITIDEFESACEIYIDYYKQKLMLDTAQNMTLIMSDLGYTEQYTNKRSVKFKGRQDAQKYYNEKLKIIKELDEEGKIESTVVNEKWLEDEIKKENKDHDENALIKFGLKEIDDVVGHLRRSNMLGILGPPKGGKTRVTNYLVNKALEEGLNVAVWPLEGTKDEWLSMQTAALIRNSSGQSMDSKKILEGSYTDDDKKQSIIAAKGRLALDKNRGTLSFIEGTAYVEDFIDVLRTHYDTENPFDIIVIDSLVNILSSTRKGKTERISEGYMLLKDFISNKLTRQALAILPTQLKQDVVDYLRRNPEETIDVTAGGESAETIRSPDEVIGLFSSKEERNVGLMKFYSVASRHSGTFDDFFCRCELNCCYLESDSSLNL